jgi:hypothetical protein
MADQLKVLWKYRFWVLLPVAVLLPLASYRSVSNLRANVQQRTTKINNLKKQLDTLAKSEQPNRSWTERVKELQGLLSQDVQVAWQQLYERQKNFLRWPRHDQYDFEREIGFRDPKNPDATKLVPVQILNAYRDTYPKYLEETWLLADPLDPEAPKKSKGLVRFPKALVFDPNNGFYWDFKGRTPTVPEIWAAQEDAWFFRAIVLAIAEANKGSQSWTDSPIKAVVQLVMGSRAVDDSFAKAGKQLQPRDVPVSLEASSGSAAGGSARVAGYYAQKTDQFKTVPVYLNLFLDQRKLWQVLASLPTAPMPLEIKQLNLARVQRAETRTGAEGQADRGALKGRREDEQYHMVQLELWGEIYLYLSPPKQGASVSAP